MAVNGWLVDTCVLSELRKPACNPGVATWSKAQRPGDIFVSDVTLMEIEFGMAQVRDRDPEFHGQLSNWYRGLLDWFSGRVLPVDRIVLLRWREMVEAGRRANRTLPQPDALIVATARVHDLLIVTRNVADMTPLGLAPVYNPWDGMLHFLSIQQVVPQSCQLAETVDLVGALPGMQFPAQNI